jgi:hypothetical protein
LFAMQFMPFDAIHNIMTQHRAKLHTFAPC